MAADLSPFPYCIEKNKITHSTHIQGEGIIQDEDHGSQFRFLHSMIFNTDLNKSYEITVEKCV